VTPIIKNAPFKSNDRANRSRPILHGTTPSEGRDFSPNAARFVRNRTGNDPREKVSTAPGAAYELHPATAISPARLLHYRRALFR